jgi:hypothetical protein
VWAIARSEEPETTVPSTVAAILELIPPDEVELRAAWKALQDRLERDSAR